MTYSATITGKKMIYQAAMVVGSAIITGLVNFLQTLPPETNAGVFGLILVILKGLENWLKHK